ncbi:hypothetical protein SNEBB_001678 [Seison nebaliae]|nr:hypothetical protein SNEBB_001678 [Seison nebaliae]
MDRKDIYRRISSQCNSTPLRRARTCGLIAKEKINLQCCRPRRNVKKLKNSSSDDERDRYDCNLKSDYDDSIIVIPNEKAKKEKENLMEKIVEEIQLTSEEEEEEEEEDDDDDDDDDEEEEVIETKTTTTKKKGMEKRFNEFFQRIKYHLYDKKEKRYMSNSMRKLLNEMNVLIDEDDEEIRENLNRISIRNKRNKKKPNENLIRIDYYYRCIKSLQLSKLNGDIAGRQKEFEKICWFIVTSLDNRQNSIIYLSGVPGTGKTLVFRDAMSCFVRGDDAQCPQFIYIAINALELTNPKDIYSQIYFELCGEKKSAISAFHLLDELFLHRFHSINFPHVFLMIDEVDVLYTKKQDAIYNIMTWAQLDNSKFSLIIISNTVNLPERILALRNNSRTGSIRIEFTTYNDQELKDIIMTRLNSVAKQRKLCGELPLNKDALQLITKSVALSAGDARKVLSITSKVILNLINEFESLGRYEKKSYEIRIANVFDAKRCIEESNSFRGHIIIKECSDIKFSIFTNLINGFKRNINKTITNGEIPHRFTVLACYEDFKMNRRQNGLEIISIDSYIFHLHFFIESRLILIDFFPKKRRNRMKKMEIDIGIFSLNDGKTELNELSATLLHQPIHRWLRKTIKLRYDLKNYLPSIHERMNEKIN